MNDGYFSALSVIWDVITRPNYGMIVAVLVIVFLQFRSNVLSFVYTALDEGIKQTFVNLILNLADIIRGYYQISRELIRSVGNYARNPFPQVDSIHMQNNDNGRSGNRSFLQRGKRILSYGPPPPLVVMKKMESPVINTTSSATSVNGLEPLEPAFLNEDDYPPNWLVFHPTLGVCSKDESDQYDKQYSSQIWKGRQPQKEEEERRRNCLKKNSNQSDIIFTEKQTDDIIDGSEPKGT